MSRNDVATQIEDGINEGLDLQEISWCETFLKTASIRQACKESLLDVSHAKEMLNRPIVGQYLITKAEAYKNANKDSLSREDLKRILNNIAQDPTTNPELRLNAISKLNSMLEFDTEHMNEFVDEAETEDIKLTAEEADAMLKQIRNNKSKEEV